MNTFLPSLPILAGLSEPALKLLSKEAQQIVVTSGTEVVQQGEMGNQLFVVGLGAVRVFKHCEHQKEKVVAVLGPGELFGEGCILTTLPRIATVQTIKDSVLYSLSSIAFYHLYQEMPDQYGILILNIARELARKLRQVDEVFAACN